MSKRVPAHIANFYTMLSLAVFAALPAIASPVDADVPDACGLDGRATGPCIIPNVSLTSGPLARALPFEVPVFIEGKVKDEVEKIDLHIFDASEPFRVVADQPCSDNASKKCIVCVLQGPSTRKSQGLKPGEWRRSDFDNSGNGSTTVTATNGHGCGLSLNASTWSHQPSPLPVAVAGSPGGGNPAPAKPEVDFVLRIPPLPANRYFVFFLEVERQLDPMQTARVWKWVEPGLDKVLLNADRTSQTMELGAWLRQIHVDACREMKTIEREEGVNVKLKAQRPGSLFDCDLPVDAVPERRTLIPDMERLIDHYSAELEPRNAFEHCAKEWTSLRDALAALGSEQLAIVSERRLKAEAQCPATVLARGGWAEGTLQEPCAASNPCETDRIQTVAEGYSKLLARLGELAGKAQDSALKDKLNLAGGLADTIKVYAEQVAGGPEAQRKAREDMLKEIEARLREVVLLDATTLGNFLTRQRGYLGADFGFAYVYGVEQAVPYLGTNIYLTPVNKNAPLPFRQWSGTWSKRFAFSLGVTMQQFDDSQTKSLFSTFNLLTGVGLRVTESIRLGGGVAWFRKKGESLLGGSNDKVNFSPYASLSLDWDVQTLINWFTNIFGRQ